MRQEEIFWFQKSSGEWLRSRDRNTKYYHVKVMGRRRRNKIHMLKNEMGIWVDKEEDLIEMVKNYFVNPFTDEKVGRDWVLTSQRWGLVDKVVLDSAARKLSAEEVRKAFFSMGAFKAPGEDGFPAGFFQRNWDVVGNEVIDLMMNMWSRPGRLEEINKTLVTLIPKIDKVEKVNN